jgi:hypothetical protein
MASTSSSTVNPTLIRTTSPMESTSSSTVPRPLAQTTRRTIRNQPTTVHLPPHQPLLATMTAMRLTQARVWVRDQRTHSIVGRVQNSLASRTGKVRALSGGPTTLPAHVGLPTSDGLHDSSKFQTPTQGTPTQTRIVQTAVPSLPIPTPTDLHPMPMFRLLESTSNPPKTPNPSPSLPSPTTSTPGTSTSTSGLLGELAE